MRSQKRRWPKCTCGQRFPSRKHLDAHVARGLCPRTTRFLTKERGR